MGALFLLKPRLVCVDLAFFAVASCWNSHDKMLTDVFSSTIKRLLEVNLLEKVVHRASFLKGEFVFETTCGGH